jgi:hypothetical protein
MAQVTMTDDYRDDTIRYDTIHARMFEYTFVKFAIRYSLYSGGVGGCDT